MGKRTIRITAKEILRKIDLFEGKTVHLITHSGNTFTGICQKQGKTEISISDSNLMWYNRKQHVHQFPITEIREIIYDLVTDY